MLARRCYLYLQPPKLSYKRRASDHIQTSQARPTGVIRPPVTQRKGMNLGLKMFVGAGTYTIHKEMKHIYNRFNSIPVKPEIFWGETSTLH